MLGKGLAGAHAGSRYVYYIIHTSILYVYAPTNYTHAHCATRAGCRFRSSATNAAARSDPAILLARFVLWSLNNMPPKRTSSSGKWALVRWLKDETVTVMSLSAVKNGKVYRGATV